MEVYEFEKCLTTYLEECSNILQCTGQPVPASRVRSEWAYHIELKIEPAGWSALWKIPRLLCEEYNIKFPTVVFGTVQQVQFKELKATFTVDFVQDDDVHLPEVYEVCLEDLWPTKIQENSALDIEGTANCIDALRFFYKNIWMPWDADNDDDLDWADRHLESRIRFYYDMKKDMNRSMVSHIRRLISEARYIQQRKELLEMELSDEEDLDDTSDKKQISKLMQLHLRMSIIKNKIELLENPEARAAFANLEDDRCGGDLKIEQETSSDDCAFIVTKIANLDHQIDYLNEVRNIIGGSKSIKLCSGLQNCLEACKSSNQIYIPTGTHSIKYLEYLNDKGLIRAIGPIEENLESRLKNDINASGRSIIKSYDEDSLLLMFDGDFVIENVVLDCRNVRQGILIRKGNVQLVNCTIIGDRHSSTCQGIVVLADSKLQLINTIVKDFATGISCQAGGRVNVDNSIIDSCGIAIDCVENCTIEFNLSKIQNSKRYGLTYLSDKVPKSEKKSIFDNINIEWSNGPLSGNCKFENNAGGSIAVYNKLKMNLNESLMDFDEHTLCLSKCDASIFSETAADRFLDASESTDSSLNYVDSVTTITIDDSIID